jgi:hypothetical protein
MTKQKFLDRLKAKWNLQSNLQVILILIVFACTGFSVLFVKPLLFRLVGFEDVTGWRSTALYLLLIFPMYQVLLLVYGFIFGQFAFFLDKEKKLLRAIGKLFTGKNK